MNTTPNEIIIDNDTASWNGTRYIYFQCQHTHSHIWPGEWRAEITRCGGDSSYIISYPISGKIITKHFCERHAREFIAGADGYTIIDRRSS